MANKRSQKLLILLVLISLSMACALTGEVTGPTEDQVDTVATSVAATLTELDALILTSEAEPTLVPDITFQGVSFSYGDSLTEHINAEVVPAYTDDINTLFTYPEHIQFTLTGYPLPEAFIEPRIKIYPVEEYLAINPFIADRLDLLQEVIDRQPPDEEGIGVVDFFNAGQFFRSQVDYIEFKNGKGVRFLTQYGQAYVPIGWPYLVYAFQGVTDDGAYFISAIFPATHPTLPHPDEVVVDEAFGANYENYAAELEVDMNFMPPDSFVPDLFELDYLIETLLVESK